MTDCQVCTASRMLDCEVQGSDAAQPVLLQLLDPRRICAELHGPADAPDPWSRELPAPGTEPRRQAACAA